MYNRYNVFRHMVNTKG